MALIKSKGAPEVTKYKGRKVVVQEKIQTKKIYGFNAKQTAERSKSPLNLTPTKIKNTDTALKTAATKNRTDSKKNYFGSTPVKLASTARKW